MTEKLRNTKIYENPEGWVIEYPVFGEQADKQMHGFWPWDEPDVESDVQDFRVNMTDSERHAVTTVLKLFTLYERKAGEDYWSGRIAKTFKRPEIQRVALMNAAVENNSHAPFYNKLNEVLYLDTEEFYSEWKSDPELSARMKFIGDVIKHEDDAVSTGGFVFVEGGILYTSFGLLKHFQSQECGKNKIKNTVRGVNQSYADEDGHAVTSATLCNIILSERNLSEEDYKKWQDVMYEMAATTYIHESKVIHKMFEKGEIGGITEQDLLDFAKHRVNVCLSYINLPPLYDEEELNGFIASWFYTDTNSYQMHDIFTGHGSEYRNDWSREKFGKVWA